MRISVGVLALFAMLPGLSTGVQAGEKPAPREAEPAAAQVVTPAATRVDFPFGVGLGPPRLYMSLSLLAEYFDHFQLAGNEEGQSEFRTSLAAGLRYNAEWPRSQLAFTSSFRVGHDARARSTRFGYGNVAAAYGYRWQRVAFNVQESFARSDDPYEG